MADLNIIQYVGTHMEPDVGSALDELKTYMETVGTGSARVLVGIADVGPGKYWIPYALTAD